MNSYLDYLDARVDRAIYVRGAQGENLSAMPDPEAWITAMETTRRKDYPAHKDEYDENARRAVKKYRERVAEGVSPILAYDCSGLTMDYALNYAGIAEKDYTAAGIYKKFCTPVEPCAMIRGQLIFKSSDGDTANITHMGTYIGNGMLVESRGRNYGVIERAYEPDEWTFAGEWKELMQYAVIMRPIGEMQLTPEQIAALQTALNALGYVDADGHPLTVDGKRGKRTNAAIEYFIRYNIPALEIAIPRVLGDLWITAGD